jgi:DNA-binding transcriptional ArsR family regulator
VFEAVAHPMRRAILERLVRGEQAAGALAEAFPVSRPAVSRHVRVLCEAGLVGVVRRGRLRVYRARTEPLAAVDDWLTRLRLAHAAALVALKERAEDARGRRGGRDGG